MFIWGPDGLDYLNKKCQKNRDSATLSKFLKITEKRLKSLLLSLIIYSRKEQAETDHTVQYELYMP